MLLTYSDVFMKGDYYQPKQIDSQSDEWKILTDDFDSFGCTIGTSYYHGNYQFARPIKPFCPEKLVEF